MCWFGVDALNQPFVLSLLTLRTNSLVVRELLQFPVAAAVVARCGGAAVGGDGVCGAPLAPTAAFRSFCNRCVKIDSVKTVKKTEANTIFIYLQINIISV